MAARYRDELPVHTRNALEAIAAIEDSHTSMERNPNETLLLHALLLVLPGMANAVENRPPGLVPSKVPPG